MDQLLADRMKGHAKRKKGEICSVLFLALCVHTCHQCKQQGTDTNAVQAQIQYVDQCYRYPTNPKQFKSRNFRLLALLRLLD